MFKAILALLLVGVGLGGGAYYNYNRNAGLDADLHKPRPYKTIATAQVEDLLKAYQADLARTKQRVAKAPGGGGAIDRADSSDVGGKAKGFATFQRDNEQWKNARGQIFEQEKTLADLRLEKSIRDRKLDDEWTRIWNRVSTF
jgi:hypothetical protein